MNYKYQQKDKMENESERKSILETEIMSAGQSF